MQVVMLMAVKVVTVAPTAEVVAVAVRVQAAMAVLMEAAVVARHIVHLELFREAAEVLLLGAMAASLNRAMVGMEPIR